MRESKRQFSGWRKSSHSVPDSNCVEVGRFFYTGGVYDNKEDGARPIRGLPVVRLGTVITTDDVRGLEDDDR